MSFRNIIFPELARIGKALASPKRLEIIDFLCQRDFSVEELAEAVDAISEALLWDMPQTNLRIDCK